MPLDIFQDITPLCLILLTWVQEDLLLSTW